MSLSKKIRDVLPEYADKTAVIDSMVTAAIKSCAGPIDFALKTDGAEDSLKAAMRLKAECDPPLDAAIAAQIQFAETLKADALKRSDELTEKTYSTIYTMLGSILAGLTVGAGFGIWIAAKKIAAPMLRLRSVMQNLARQELDVDVDGQDRRDEIGGIAKTVQVFKDNAIAMRRMEAESAEQRRLADEAEARTQAEREAVSARLAEVVEGLANGLGRLSQGDLTCELNKPSAAYKPPFRTSWSTRRPSRLAPGRSPAPPTTWRAARSSKRRAWNRQPRHWERSPQLSREPPPAAAMHKKLPTPPNKTPSNHRLLCVMPFLPWGISRVQPGRSGKSSA
jgi:methyl-accepting chemotaxis protein